jgi:glycosyltransferase involved in cell wall biosynthesis
MRVSIPIATYNRSQFLVACLDSIMAQTYQDFEVIIVDDASTDETPEVVARYGHRVKYVRHEQNQGFIQTFVHASSLCTGTYETYFGDDDVLMPEFLERGVAILDSDPSIGKFCTDCYMIGPDGNRIGTKTYLDAYQRESGKVTVCDLLEFGCFVHLGLNRRSIVEELGRYDPTFTHAADYDLYLRMTGAGYSIYFLNEPLMCYRIHPNMRSHRESEMWAETIRIMELNAERFPEAAQSLGRKLEKRLGMNKAWLAVRLFWEGQFAQSLRYGLSATGHYIPAVPIGAAQMAVSKLKGKRSVYRLSD